MEPKDQLQVQAHVLMARSLADRLLDASSDSDRHKFYKLLHLELKRIFRLCNPGT
jgi:hypothetical protein